MTITRNDVTLNELIWLKNSIEQMPCSGAYIHKMANIIGQLTLAIKLCELKRESDKMFDDTTDNVRYTAAEFLHKHTVK